jgi:hypothetical protein
VLITARPPGRICPLICETGYRADGERCVKITCRAGHEPNDDGSCQKIQVKKPIAKREEPKAERRIQSVLQSSPHPLDPRHRGKFFATSKDVGR